MVTCTGITPCWQTSAETVEDVMALLQSYVESVTTLPKPTWDVQRNEERRNTWSGHVTSLVQDGESLDVLRAVPVQDVMQRWAGVVVRARGATNVQAYAAPGGPASKDLMPLASVCVCFPTSSANRFWPCSS
jgi:hypothetical protein